MDELSAGAGDGAASNQGANVSGFAIRLLCRLLVLSATLAWCGAAQAGEVFLDPGFVAEIGCGFGDEGAAERLPAGWRLRGQQARKDRLICRFRGPDGAEAEAVLSSPDGPCESGVRADRFCIEGENLPAAVAEVLRERLDAADSIDPWSEDGPGLEESVAGAAGVASDVLRDLRWAIVHTTMGIRAEYLLQAVWLLVLGLLAFRLFAGLRAVSWNVWLARLLLFVAALGLRVLLRTEGPGDIYFHMGDGFTGYAAASYGAAPAALVQVLLRLFPLDLDVLFVALLVVGAAAPVFLGMAVYEWDGDLRVAHVAGWLMAFHPLAVRFSGAANRSTYVLTLGLVALWSLVRYLNRRDRVDLALHGLALILMVQSRPEAFLGLPLYPLAVFALAPGRWAGRERRLPRDVLGVQALVVVVVAANAFLNGGSEATGMTMARYLQDAGGLDFSISNRTFLDPTFHPYPAILLCIVGIVWTAVRPTSLAGWSVIAMEVAALPSFVMPAAAGDLANARYQILTAMPARIVIAIGVVRTADLLADRIGKAWVFPAVSLSLLATIGLSAEGHLRSISAPRTIDHEFSFLVRTLEDLPPDAEIVYVYPLPEKIWDFSLRPPVELSTILGRPGHRWIAWEPDLPRSDRPRYFYRQAACSVSIAALDDTGRSYMREVRDRCEHLYRACRARVVVEDRVPAFRWEADHYRSATVPLGFYRLD